ncbi:MAG: Ion transport 2 domain-containing protein [Nitrospirae bacterium]|nr:MAG: Ion transport 2 domain-containing protein [Nitrospirota bacterium]
MFSQISYLLHGRAARRNVRMLARYLFFLVALVTFYSTVFHFLMEFEGRTFSWVTGFYWTLTVMSTLGFGDITFTSDQGRIFSMVVLLSGVIYLLVMLPFTFIQFFYAPWLEAQEKSRAPNELPVGTSGHVILTNTDPISLTLVKRLNKYRIDYAIIVEDLQSALDFHDKDFRVVVGRLDDPETFRRLRTEAAALVVVNNNDMINSNIIFTIRELSDSVRIVTNADSDDSVDILQLAGATYVFQFTRELGESLARRAIGASMHANVIGRFGQLLIAEAPAMRMPFEGKTLKESNLRRLTGVTVVGIWERGRFEIPAPDTVISGTSVLVLAGSEIHLKTYDELFEMRSEKSRRVLILGGGRVGRAAAEALKEQKIAYCIVETNKEFIEDNDNYIHGSAADIKTLVRAGIYEAPTVFVTTHDDDINIYLTIYCRKLRPDIQIISRSTLDRNISKLHSAGADLVMSYASLGVNTIINILRPDEVLMLTEGLNVFRLPVPSSLAGVSLGESGIRQRTGCSVVAIHSGGSDRINPDPATILQKSDELILIGSADAETRFIELYT